MVYVLHGPDEFASTEAVADLKTQMGDPSLASLNITTLDPKQASVPELKSICDTMPFLTSQRLVIVEGWLTKLAGKGESEADDEDSGSGAAKETIKALVEFLPTVPDSTILVLVEKRALPESNAVLKAAAKGQWAQIKFFDLPKGEGLVTWIRKRAKAEGGELTREAAQALSQIENDPRALGNEIAKLITYVNAARPVELDDVETLTPAGGESNIFNMVDAIGQRKGPAALRELHKLLEKEEPLYVLSMIVRQYRLMLQARELLDARQPDSEVAKILGLHPFPAGKICAQARNFSITTLERIYRRLLDYDADIKTGALEPAVALDTLVTSLTAA